VQNRIDRRLLDGGILRQSQHIVGTEGQNLATMTRCIFNLNNVPLATVDNVFIWIQATIVPVLNIFLYNSHALLLSPLMGY
jgi:hypothetical protein